MSEEARIVTASSSGQESPSDTHLFAPFRLRGLTIRNRVVLSPLCQYMAIEGGVQDWHFGHHAHFALGGLGAAFVEATAVTRDGRITHGCTGIWDDAHIPGLKRIVEIYRTHGVACGIQIGHAGRRASCVRPWDGATPIEADAEPEPRWRTVGASPLPEKPGYPVPRELTIAEINEIVAAFAHATRRALAAGFDIVEIHGAHGYLLHSFVSPISNKRHDAYGGSPERRMRLSLEVARAVRSEWPDDRPLFYRASCVDGLDGGLVIDDTVALARELKNRGVDLIDCSAGGIAGSATLSNTRIIPGFMVPHAEAVRRQAGIATMAVGAIIDPHQADRIVRGGRADLVAIGRELMTDPNWAYHAALALGLDNPHDVLPAQYAFYLKRREAVLDRTAPPL